MDNQNPPAAPVNNNPLASDLPVSEVVSALKNAPPIDITPATPLVAPAVPSMTPSLVLAQTPVTPGPEPTVQTNNPVMPQVPAAPVAPSAANPPLAEAAPVVPGEPAKEGVSPLYENPDLVEVPGSK